MRRFYLLFLAGLFLAVRVKAVDVYGAASSAQSVALGGLFAGSGSGPTDSLAANPAALTFIGRPLLEVSGMGVLAHGAYQNSTPYLGSLSNSAGLAGSAAFASRVGASRISLGVGVFPVSLLSDQWRYADPAGTAGVSYGIQTNKSAFIALQPTVGIGIQVTKRLAVGAGFGILYNANTLETPYIFQNNALSGLKTLLNLHTNGVGYNGTIGAIFTATRTLEFDLAYKTETTVHTTGTANGNASTQFAALGLPFQPTFRYTAEVNNTFPQSVSANIAWQARRRIRTHLQADWINWRSAFVNLPVHLTGGANPDINALLGSSSLDDSIPLAWRNQLAWRAGMEASVTENATVLGGYSYTNSPVPSRTLTPMTADIMRNALSTGISYHRSRYRFELAYQANLPSSAEVGTSQLLAGEYDHSKTSLWLQTIVLTTGIRF
ncbi:MAG: outer membrane protein transport protein [Acidobacteriaceae bacterium]|nr:outer membrane protein transport protein [Acidobacteriaceae bacterium]